MIRPLLTLYDFKDTDAFFSMAFGFLAWHGFGHKIPFLFLSLQAFDLFFFFFWLKRPLHKNTPSFT